MKVHKFGGTCMASPDRLKAVAELIINEPAQQTVTVVSAMGSCAESPVKVTDLILNMIDKAARQDAAFLVDLAALQEKHVETAKKLLGQGPELTAFVSRLMDDIGNLKAMLQAICIAGMATDAFVDFVVGHGELWSAQLLAATCKQMGADVAFMDTRDVLVVTPTSDGTSVDLDEEASNKRLDEWFKQHGNHKLVIATGFIAKNQKGQATTLKRNGSDFSATIMGALFRSGHITIWTDVDGVYSADPRKVPEAVCLPSLTYHEAWELSYFGANVLHPRTTLPAMKYSIPIAIRNFFNLAAPGTQVLDLEAEQKFSKGAVTIKGFATIDNVCLINIEGTGMVGVPGIASAVFSTVRDAGVNVIMISQASSEHSICFAVKGSEGDTAVAVLKKRFADSISAGRVSGVERIDNCCVLAAVGQGMVRRKGVAATMMGALAKANVNIKALAQGSSEYNITVLIDQKDSERALRAVHSRFYLSDVPIGVGIVGPGLIGGTLIEQLREQAVQLREEFNIDIRVLGIADSKHMLTSEGGIDLANWRQQWESNKQPSDLQAFGDALASSYIPNLAIVDCTASDAPPAHYLEWMGKGLNIITPNKKLGSGPLERYQAVRRMQRESYIHFFYEGTVGAGLPIIGTLKHLLETGDKAQLVEGVFSGTLSFIFNTFGDGRPFSEIVKDAKAQGYTEPDPRDDLNGTDVARKVAILARECGLMLELDDIPVESLVPEPLRSCKTAEEYMSRLPEFDADMAAKLDAARASGEVLRYVGVVDVKAGKGSVELRRYPASHPFAQLQGSDNIIAFTTARYGKQQPLIVRGPGAGAAVTAGGVFSDLLRLAAYLGAPS
uniref:ACT domain-containing protein n=1 Tax=Tetradesmus obliquus TaxID=3088 RepID=A0A383V4M3_TETOB|eukprot:jgi/Sobl393_1/253/SZX60041.1